MIRFDEAIFFKLSEVSQKKAEWFGWRESTWELRLLTGTLFGLGNIWFVLPMIQKTLDETPSVQRQPVTPIV